MDALVLKVIYTNLLVVFITTIAHTATIVPSGISNYDFIQDQIFRSSILSPDSYDYQLGSYDLSKIEFGQNYRYNLYVKNNIGASDKFSFLQLFNIFEERISSEKNKRLNSYEFLRAGFSGNPGKNIFIYANLLLDEEKADDSSYTGKKWRGLAGGVENGFINYSTNNFSFTFGRFASFWGRKNSLVLSSANSMDGFGYNWQWGKLRLSYRLARLDNLIDQTISSSVISRYFAAHRLDIHFSPKFRLAFFETAIFGGVGRQIEMAYLNPIIFYHSTQLNEATDDNTFLGLDFDLNISEKIQLFGQLMVDDFQIDNDTNGDKEPNQYGILLATDWINLANNLDFSAQYNRVSNWTYNQVNERNKYLYHNNPIGGEFGNDYDFYKFSLTKWINSELNIFFSYRNIRQGEGSINSPWSAPWLSATTDYKEKFPTGVVQTTSELSLGIKGFLYKNYFVSANSGYKSTSNFQHIAGDDIKIPFINILVSSYFSTAVNIR